MRVEDLGVWVENNFEIMVDQIDQEVLKALLFCAKRRPSGFRRLMIHGLKRRLWEDVGTTHTIVQALPVYVSECRIKVALAASFLNTPGGCTVPLFSMSFADEDENRTLRECEMLAFGEVSHAKRSMHLGWTGGRV